MSGKGLYETKTEGDELAQRAEAIRLLNAAIRGLKNDGEVGYLVAYREEVNGENGVSFSVQGFSAGERLLIIASILRETIADLHETVMTPAPRTAETQAFIFQLLKCATAAECEISTVLGSPERRLNG